MPHNLLWHPPDCACSVHLKWTRTCLRSCSLASKRPLEFLKGARAGQGSADMARVSSLWTSLGDPAWCPIKNCMLPTSLIWMHAVVENGVCHALSDSRYPSKPQVLCNWHDLPWFLEKRGKEGTTSSWEIASWAFSSLVMGARIDQEMVVKPSTSSPNHQTPSLN